MLSYLLLVLPWLPVLAIAVALVPATLVIGARRLP